MIELILIHPRRGIIRSPFLGALDPETKDFQYVLQVKWGYSECVEVQGTLDSLMSAIKTAVAQSGITVIADSYGSQLKGTDKQFIAMLECFSPDKNTWSTGAQEWYKKATSSRYVLPDGYTSAVASAASTDDTKTTSVAPRPQGSGAGND